MASLYITLTEAGQKLLDGLNKAINENRKTETTEMSIARSISSACSTFSAREIIKAKNSLVAEEKKQNKNWTKVTRGFLGKEGKPNLVNKQIEKGLVNGDSY
jgi:hypothetical protein